MLEMLTLVMTKAWPWSWKPPNLRMLTTSLKLSSTLTFWLDFFRVLYF